MGEDRGLTARKILSFWLPLAGTWIMMTVEAPFLAAVIARMPHPEENLAAYGVAYSLAVILESPIIMLMIASTALVKNKETYLALRRFANRLNLLLTVCVVVVLLPPVFHLLSRRLLALPEEVARLAHSALVILLPWPAAIGYRRFHQGLLIRNNQTRSVAYGTVLRLLSMGLTALVMVAVSTVSGAHAGAIALSIGVVAEAVASRLMARGIVRQLLQARPGEGAGTGLTLREILEFYVPLAMTAILAMAVQPLVTSFMGHSRQALESLAALPVVISLTFIFTAMGISYQDVVVARLGEHGDNYLPLRNFAILLGTVTTAVLAVIAFTPLSVLWFHHISGLSLELTAFCRLPTRILSVMPALTVLLCFHRAVMVCARRTTPVTAATVVEFTVITAVLWGTIYRLDMIGVVGGAVAIVAGRAAGNIYLSPRGWRAIRDLGRDGR
jgi:hypothetical protein